MIQSLLGLLFFGRMWRQQELLHLAEDRKQQKHKDLLAPKMPYLLKFPEPSKLLQWAEVQVLNMGIYRGYLIFISNHSQAAITTHKFSSVLCITLSLLERCFCIRRHVVCSGCIWCLYLSSVLSCLDHDVQECAGPSVCIGFAELFECVHLCLLPALGSCLPLAWNTQFCFFFIESHWHEI